MARGGGLGKEDKGEGKPETRKKKRGRSSRRRRKHGRAGGRIELGGGVV